MVVKLVVSRCQGWCEFEGKWVIQVKSLWDKIVLYFDLSGGYINPICDYNKQIKHCTYVVPMSMILILTHGYGWCNYYEKLGEGVHRSSLYSLCNFLWIY